MLIVCPGAWHSISSILDRFSGRELREGAKAVKTGERWRGWYIEGLGGRHCAFWHMRGFERLLRGAPVGYQSPPDMSTSDCSRGLLMVVPEQRARRYPLDNWRDPYGARVSVKSTVTTWPELTLADWVAGW